MEIVNDFVCFNIIFLNNLYQKELQLVGKWSPMLLLLVRKVLNRDVIWSPLPMHLAHHQHHPLLHLALGSLHLRLVLWVINIFIYFLFFKISFWPGHKTISSENLLFNWLVAVMFEFKQSFGIGWHKQNFISVEIDFEWSGVNDSLVLSASQDEFCLWFCHFDTVSHQEE